MFDLVGGALIDQHLGALKNRGRLVLVGLMAGSRAQVDLGQVLRRRLIVVGSVLRARSRAEKAELVAGFARFAGSAGLAGSAGSSGSAGDRLAAGRIRPVIDRVLPFDRIADAYGALEQGGVTGKVVVTLG